MNNVTNKAKI